jgi:hypothetical protein
MHTAPICSASNTISQFNFQQGGGSATANKSYGKSSKPSDGRAWERFPDDEFLNGTPITNFAPLRTNWTTE